MVIIIIRRGECRVEALSQVQRHAGLHGVQPLVVARELGGLVRREIKVCVEYREESHGDEGCDVLTHMVFRLRHDPVERQIVGPDHRCGHERVVEPPEFQRHVLIRQAARLVLEEGAVKPQLVFAEIATLPSARIPERLVLRDRLVVLTRSNT